MFNATLLAAMLILAAWLAPYLIIIAVIVILISYAMYKAESRHDQDVPMASGTKPERPGKSISESPENYGYSQSR